MSTYVLVAEDDRKQAELIRRYLAHDGHEVSVVHDGRTALGEATRRPPDLLVLDWMLPAWTGWRYAGDCGVPASCPSSCSPPAPRRTTFFEAWTSERMTT
ncbi:hypothetical protein OKW18_006694 [Streptomyces pratensis]|nr:hypothetical protein [Streptomyces pratensis]